MSTFEGSPKGRDRRRVAVEEVLGALRASDADGLDREQLQSLFAHVVRAYARLREEVGEVGAFPAGNDISATEVAIAATGILEAADMAVFELGMWQTLKH